LCSSRVECSSISASAPCCQHNSSRGRSSSIFCLLWTVRPLQLRVQTPCTQQPK
jgi:hypothetical protein